jgi:hypothetical protein
MRPRSVSGALVQQLCNNPSECPEILRNYTCRLTNAAICREFTMLGNLSKEALNLKSIPHIHQQNPTKPEVQHGGGTFSGYYSSLACRRKVWVTVSPEFPKAPTSWPLTSTLTAPAFPAVTPTISRAS